jgi:DnaJ-class molecular chaperone
MPENIQDEGQWKGYEEPRVCPTCVGLKTVREDPVEDWVITCPACNGTGYALKIPGPLRCPDCKGEKYVWVPRHMKCPTCNGTGEVRDGE